MNTSGKTKKIAILLSSYNGRKYINEQLVSLLKQDCFYHIDIHIRDDGSADNSVGIIKNIMQQNANVFLYEGENVGVIKSFLWLVDNIEGYDYYAFCDQDDVWEPLKLMAAVNKLERNDNKKPLAYCSAYDFVDQDLSFIGRYHSASDFSASNLLIENCAPGCTMVFNSALRDKYCSLKLENISQRIVMHDWFFLLLALGFGEVIYDYNSYLFYRQHGNNVVGKKTGFWEIFNSKVKQFRKERKRPQHLLFLQSELIAECCAENKQKNIYQISNQFVESQCGLLSRIQFISGGYVKRVRLIDDVIFKLLYILGYYK